MVVRIVEAYQLIKKVGLVHKNSSAVKPYENVLFPVKK